jgi:hypothetical protein
VTDFPGSLRTHLLGGDRRSLARSDRALGILREQPERVGELAALASDGDPLVSQRALDLLEKLARERPEWVEPHKAVFLGGAADAERWEARLQVVRTFPLFSWSAAQRRRVVEILLRDIRHPQKFVRAWALDSLAAIGAGDPKLRRIVQRHLRLFERSGSKALVARARHIRERLVRKSGEGGPPFLRIR